MYSIVTNCNSCFWQHFYKFSYFSAFLCLIKLFSVLKFWQHWSISILHATQATNTLTVTATYCPTRCCTWPSLLPSLDLLLGVLSLSLH